MGGEEGRAGQGGAVCVWGRKGDWRRERSEERRQVRGWTPVTSLFHSLARTDEATLMSIKEKMEPKTNHSPAPRLRFPTNTFGSQLHLSSCVVKRQTALCCQVHARVLCANGFVAAYGAVRQKTWQVFVRHESRVVENNTRRGLHLM